MNKELPSIESPKTSPIESAPRLRYIRESTNILLETDYVLGNWKDLYCQVENFNKAADLSDKVRKVVYNYVQAKTAELKKIPALADLSEEGLANAITHNWFDEIEQVRGQRRGILLTVLAHVVRRIEIFAYKNILENLKEEDWKRLGWDRRLKSLLPELLGVAAKANPLFIRFAAMAQLTPPPPDQARPDAIFLSEDSSPHTLNELFRKETQFLSKKLNQIATAEAEWKELPGADLFRDYLILLGRYYSEGDPGLAEEHRQAAHQLFVKLAQIKFPIVLNLGNSSYTKEPYLDPELYVSVVSPENSEEEEGYGRVKAVAADLLKESYLERYISGLQETVVLNTTAMGAFGSNLIFNTVADNVGGVILIYGNEHRRGLDEDFLKYVQMTGIKEFNLDQDRTSKLLTVLHELGHAALTDEKENIKRFGLESSTTLDEIKADLVFRAFLPNFLETRAISGDREQWSAALLGSFLQTAKESAQDDPYYISNTIILNRLMAGGAVEFAEGQLRIVDQEKFFSLQKELADEVIKLHQDPQMSEDQIKIWLKKNSSPGVRVKPVINYLKAKN